MGLPVAVFAAVLAVLPLEARAWMRVHYEDEEIVKRSDLIVVGAIKDGTVVVVPHAPDQGGVRSWATRATLRVREVVKGQCEEKELPIVVRYGLNDPVRVRLETQLASW